MIKFLEQAPGVKSAARAIAVGLAVLTAVIVIYCLEVARYAITHAKDHEEHAALAINAAKDLVQTIGVFILVPVLGGIWIALGLRKEAPGDSTTTSTTTITQVSPNAAPAVVTVEPAIPVQSPANTAPVTEQPKWG
jgi:hypothetical protein